VCPQTHPINREVLGSLFHFSVLFRVRATLKSFVLSFAVFESPPPTSFFIDRRKRPGFYVLLAHILFGVFFVFRTLRFPFFSFPLLFFFLLEIMSLLAGKIRSLRAVQATWMELSPASFTSLAWPPLHLSFFYMFLFFFPPICDCNSSSRTALKRTPTL